MADVIVTAEDVIVTVAQPVIPPTAPPVAIGLVQIDQIVQRGSIWLTGSGPPASSGGQIGDLYLDVDTGDIYRWEGSGWVFQGTFAPSTDTPAEVLAKLVTVDGAGSNLDADLLDGQQGAWYATQADMTTAQSNISSNTTAITSNTGNINTNTTAISTETTNRQNADTTLQANINLKANIASPVFTGDPQAPTPGVADNDTSIATTAFVKSQGYLTSSTAGTTYAPIASPTFTGDPQAPTPVSTDNDTSIATTAFVKTALAALPPSGIPEAPNDGQTYGRKSLAWAAVVGGAAISDTPPASPINGQLWFKSNEGNTYVWYADPNSSQWLQVNVTAPLTPLTARRSNLTLNGNCFVNLEQPGTVTTTGAYPAEMWVLIFNGIAGQASQMVAGSFPSGSRWGVWVGAATAKASLVATDNLSLVHLIEGVRLSNLKWTTAQAIPGVVRFSAYADTPGIYTFSIRDNPPSISFVKSINLTATPQTFVIPVPVPPSGTWPNDNTRGMNIGFTAACGANFMAAADNAWQTGNLLGAPGQINAAATASKNLYISDLGVYADPDNTGLPPPYEIPDYTLELTGCMRYWRVFSVSQSGYGNTSGDMQVSTPLVPIMRANAASAMIAAGTNTNVAAATVFPSVDRINMQIQPTAVGNMGLFNRQYSLNARM